MNAMSFPAAPRIRRVVMDDADFAYQLAVESYDRPLDMAACKKWLATVLDNPRDIFCCRGPNSLGIAASVKPFYSPDRREVHLVYLMARRNSGLEGLAMMRAMVEWARSLEAEFHFGSTTGFDLAPFAKRIGAVANRPSWSLKT